MTSARDLTARLADLLRRERNALAEFLLALADFDRKRLWLELGHPSLFYLLHRELGLSKGAASPLPREAPRSAGRRLELDHVVPKALGGPPTIESSRLLCQVHNQYAARQVYGDELMDRYTRRRSGGEGKAHSGP